MFIRYHVLATKWTVMGEERQEGEAEGEGEGEEGQQY